MCIIHRDEMTLDISSVFAFFYLLHVLLFSNLMLGHLRHWMNACNVHMLSPKLVVDSTLYGLYIRTACTHLLSISTCKADFTHLLPCRFDIAFKRLRGAVTNRILHWWSAVRLASRCRHSYRWRRNRYCAAKKVRSYVSYVIWLNVCDN